MSVKNTKALIFDKETGSLKQETVKCIHADSIETKQDIYMKEDCQKYLSETDNNVYYLVTVDLPAKVEAENLKNLRRSMTLNNLFNYDVKKPFDLISLMPWAVIFGMIVFG